MSEYTNRKSKDSSIPIKPKRSKTGYNLFFSEFVKELKESNQGEDSPAERGKMARLVGQAWKKIDVNERNKYEAQAALLNKSKTDGSSASMSEKA
mmetsp:Transcript_3977/g.7612  ORF Transcript_3977/g.7612 Transcript_3977/m.7612 type:complete len:95 (-) Transcript_3977:402-686(-)